MDDNAVESTLSFFKSKSQVKGLNAYEKLKALSQRWHKVIEDCEKSNDNSKYRHDFKEAHKLPLAIINNSLKELNPESEDQAKMVVQNLRSRFLFSLANFQSLGAIDALGFIISELESCT